MMKWQDENPDFTVALDIGTTKVCVLVGRRNDLGQIQVLGSGRYNSEGVQRGVVHNINKTVRAIHEAVVRAERKINDEIKEVHVGIAGQHIESRQNHGMITREDNFVEIGQQDIDNLIKSMRRLPLKPGEEFLHIIPQDFAVDDEWGITEPIGMCGTRLGANFHIITCQNSASGNLMRCVTKAGLEVADLTLEPIASAASVLSEADKRDGVVLIDIGGGTTDITIFTDGVINHTYVLPFGGDVVTSDIREVFGISVADAELMKREYGCALASEADQETYISIANRHGDREPQEISVEELAQVIQARMESILRYVDFQITASDSRSRLQGGIVLTGGGSLLRNVDKLTEYYTGIPTRIGFPTAHLAPGYDSDLNSPIYSTSVGLLIRGIERRERDALLAVTAAPEPVAQTKASAAAPLQEAAMATAAMALESQDDQQRPTLIQGVTRPVMRLIERWFEQDEDPDMV